MKKYVLIIQCDIAHRRCSGWACMKSFYDRTGAFKDLAEEDIKYISFTCGGCCGKGVAAKIEHFANKLAKQTDASRGRSDYPPVFLHGAGPPSLQQVPACSYDKRNSYQT